MNKNITKDKSWIFGIVILVLGIILSISFPSIFTDIKLLFGITLVLVGIVMVYQACTENLTTNYK